ncbi:MAG TPA: hypothetical protein VMT18_13130 [Planctomycetota bacterium]|nr:hypothetical protein [Planctomycetota bacterium]
MLSRKLRTRLLALMLGAAGTLLAAEVALRFLPVATPMRPLPVHAGQPVFRFAPGRAYTFSQDWNFHLANRGWINAAGFVNDQEYVTESPLPLLAVVGDSFIEAAMVPYAETLQGRLAADVAGRGRVYSFAASGAPLSQYLVWAEYAREHFAPEALVITVVGNDFDESMARYSLYPGLHHFTPGADGGLELVRVDFTPSRLGPLVYASALGRYVLLNLRARALLGRLFAGGTELDDTWFVGNTPGSYTPERLAAAQQAVDAFLERLPAASGLPPERVLLLVDGMRPELYDPPQLERAETSFFGVMRRTLLERARAQGFEALDLQPAMLERHAREGLCFEFPTDYHWNGAGHGAVADVARGSRLWRDFLERLEPQ